MAPLALSEAHRSHEAESDTRFANSDTDSQTDRPKSLFPGPSFNTKAAEQAIMDAHGSSQAAQYHQISKGSSHGKGKNYRTHLTDLSDLTGNSGVASLPELSRRRKFVDDTDETEKANIRIRPPQTRSPAQLTHWESMKDEVATVERIWDELEDNHIYVTSTVDIEELALRRHPKHRLWSWSKEEKG